MAYATPQHAGLPVSRPDWVRFGQNGMVAANDPVEQEKDVKFTSLLANLFIFHNTLDIADVVRELQGRGPRGRPARPRAGLPVSDRAHQAVRRVLHPRARHHPRRLRRPSGRRSMLGDDEKAAAA
ncbi:Tn3 family transposase [Streptomyces sp. NPDC004227]